MKTLIINGSPHRDGDTAGLLVVLKSRLTHNYAELSAYRGNISPCVDCRHCWKEPKCAIDDDMRVITRMILRML
jgi:multimeric flavodoxin WrbA